MFEHAHADDTVENTSYVTVVFKTVFQPASHRRLQRALPGAFKLLSRQSHTLHISHVPDFCQIARHATPATADIENALLPVQQ
ncbi:hypothetical protein D3C71_1663030 [compost metagenome]